MLSSVIKRVSLLVVLASGLGCRSAPAAETRAQMSFRPTRDGARLWLATSFAVELVTETDARAIEAMDPQYIGELGARGHVRRAQVAAIAAEKGATHYRIIDASNELRVDVVLYRIEPDRWTRLPTELRPTAPATSSLRGERLSGT